MLPEGDFCGRCHWLSRCEGCVIPYDDPELEVGYYINVLLVFLKIYQIDLDGGITIAIDWHFVVFQVLLVVLIEIELLTCLSRRFWTCSHCQQ